MANSRPGVNPPQRQSGNTAQRRISNEGQPRLNTRPGTPFKTGWGVRFWAFLFLGGLSFWAIYDGIDDESALPEGAGFAIAGALLLIFILLFVQQTKQKFVLFPDRLERYGLRGLVWAVEIKQMEHLLYDPTQGGFPFGRGVTIYDRQQRMLTVPRGIKDVKQLGGMLTELHTAVALPDIFMLLESGDTIRFGDEISVNRDMIVAPDPATKQPTQYGLRDFQQAFMKSGKLTMNMAGKSVPLVIKISELLNAHMLMQVVMKAKALGPKIERIIPISHDSLDRTDAMDKVSVTTGESDPVKG